jgi:glutaredoxin
MAYKQFQHHNTAAPKQRHLSGLIVILIVFAVLVFINYRPSIERVHCTDEILSTQPEVIMLGTWWCQYCYQARRYFTDHNINYCEYDIERSAEGEKLYNEINARAVPVLLVDKYIINGFDEARLEQLLDKVRQAS